MDNQRNEEKGWQSEGESLNTGSSSPTENNSETQKHDHKKGGIHNNALYAASMGRPATAAVDPHSLSGLEQTGTNPAYEGPVGAGAGGSAGTGYTSGQSDTGQRPTSGSDYDRAGIGSTHKEDKIRQDADDAADETEGQR